MKTKNDVIIPEDVIPVSLKIANLQQWILSALARAQQTKHWGKFQKRYRMQNVLQHTLEQTILTDLVCIVQNYFGQPVNTALMLRAALTHDLGEKGAPNHLGEGNFDSPWTTKQSATGVSIDEEERVRFLSWLQELPLPTTFANVAKDIVAEYTCAYELQHQRDTREGRLFNALERVGYVLHMLEEVDNGNVEYAIDIPKHVKDINEYSKEFISIRIIFDILWSRIAIILQKT